MVVNIRTLFAVLTSALLVLCLLAPVPVQARSKRVCAESPAITSTDESVQTRDPMQRMYDENLIKDLNQMPGMNVPSTIMDNCEQPPIHGFHPIKKLFQPVEKMACIAAQLGQQIMRLEGPLAALQPSMAGLRDKIGLVASKMTAVDMHIDKINGNVVSTGKSINGINSALTGVNSNLGSVRSDLQTMRGSMDGVRSDLENMRLAMTGVRSDLSGVRSDLAKVTNDLVAMRREVNELQGPISDLRTPISGVARPLEGVQVKLDRLTNLMATILAAIFVTSAIVAIGTPVAAVLLFKYRHFLLPGLKDKDMPVMVATDAEHVHINTPRTRKPPSGSNPNKK